MLRRHHLGDDRQAGRFARLGQQFQSLLLQPLEAVRAGARLERAAAQAGRARLLDDMGDLQDLLSALHRTRPGDDADRAAADLQVANLARTVGSFFTSVLAILYGARIGTTFSTPSIVSRACLAPSRFSPRAATTVSSVPSMRWRASHTELFDQVTTSAICLGGVPGVHNDDHVEPRRSGRRKKRNPGEIDAGVPY